MSYDVILYVFEGDRLRYEIIVLNDVETFEEAYNYILAEIEDWKIHLAENIVVFDKVWTKAKLGRMEEIDISRMCMKHWDGKNYYTIRKKRKKYKG